MFLSVGDVIRCEIAISQLKGRDNKSFPDCFRGRSQFYEKTANEWDVMPILDKIGAVAIELFQINNITSVNAKIIHSTYRKLCTSSIDEAYADRVIAFAKSKACARYFGDKEV